MTISRFVGLLVLLLVGMFGAMLFFDYTTVAIVTVALAMVLFVVGLVTLRPRSDPRDWEGDYWVCPSRDAGSEVEEERAWERMP
ncbi:hypothetical protein [Thermogemmatispora sp.]|uniref:hypothetical protein n=1 Tax=Thermogemmatispora sp. TaxID=1968838 RepID=UPI0035E45BA7